MSVEVERATLPCPVCSAAVSELRRGRCWGCYTRWVEARPVGRGAVCTICFEKRRDQLRLVELKGRSCPLCHGCAARLARMDEMPATMEGIRRALKRDRRDTERRDEGRDHRIFPRERRVGERRTPPRLGTADTDPRILASDLEDVIIELREDDVEEVEQTYVRGGQPAKGSE